MTDYAPLTSEARQALLDTIDRAWSNPAVAQVQVLFKYRAHAQVTVFTHEQQTGGFAPEGDARTLLIAMGADRGRVAGHETTEEGVGVLDYVAHRDNVSSVKVAVQYATKQPALT